MVLLVVRDGLALLEEAGGVEFVEDFAGILLYLLMVSDRCLRVSDIVIFKLQLLLLLLIPEVGLISSCCRMDNMIVIFWR